MSAAANRAEKLEPRPDESTPPAGTIPGNQEDPPVIDGARVTGTNRSSISNQGMTPLMRAACDGQAGTVRALLDRGAEVNAQRSDGFNALALAAFFGHSQVVWLLMENGADLAAAGRSETTPEMWADARGYFEIADALREARSEQVEVSSLSNALIEESARFARPTESETPQTANGPSSNVADADIDETTDSEAALMTRATPLAGESIPTNGESRVDILPTDKPQPVTEQTPKAVKTLPEIEDPPPLVVPKFHPGSAFVARIASSRTNLVALILAAVLGTGLVAFLFPQIRESLREWQTASISNTTKLPTDSSKPVEQSGTSDSGSAPVTQPANEPASTNLAEPPANPVNQSVESPSHIDSATIPEKGSVDTAAASGAESRARPASDNQVSDTPQDQQESTATTGSRSVTRARKQRAVSRTLKFKQQTVAEEQPKPAPLSVETSRSRSALAPPPVAATEPPSNQPAPVSNISGKPKSKVIQWP